MGATVRGRPLERVQVLHGDDSGGDGRLVGGVGVGVLAHRRRQVGRHHREALDVLPWPRCLIVQALDGLAQVDHPLPLHLGGGTLRLSTRHADGHEDAKRALLDGLGGAGAAHTEEASRHVLDLRLDSDALVLEVGPVAGGEEVVDVGHLLLRACAAAAALATAPSSDSAMLPGLVEGGRHGSALALGPRPTIELHGDSRHSRHVHARVVPELADQGAHLLDDDGIPVLPSSRHDSDEVDALAHIIHESLRQLRHVGSHRSSHRSSHHRTDRVSATTEKVTESHVKAIDTETASEKHSITQRGVEATLTTVRSI